MADAVALPSSFVRRTPFGLSATSFAVLGAIVGVSLDGSPPWGMVAFYLPVGVVALVWAWRLRQRPALVFDDEGIRDGEGDLLVSWSQAALIWVGHGRWRGWLSALAYPQLVVWTAPSLDFAKRTGLPATQQVSRFVPTSLTAEEIEELLSRFSGCPVRSGDPAAFKRLTSSLRTPISHA